MKKIGITQRVDTVGTYMERRDSLDQRWYTLLDQFDMMAVPIPNQPSYCRQLLADMQVHGFILSGGNDISGYLDAANTSTERDLTERKVLDYASHNRMPVLGVCRGFQMMNIYLNGKLKRMFHHASQKHMVRFNANAMVYGSSFETEVNSFHNWGIENHDLGDGLDVMATAHDSSVEGAVHTILPWVGIMWHPEREAELPAFDAMLIKKLFG